MDGESRERGDFCMSLVAYAENITVGQLTSRSHKAVRMRQLLAPMGIGSSWIAIAKNVEEAESHSPRQIVKRKMADFSRIASDTLSWMAEEAHICPTALAVLDVLALLMPEGSQDFRDAERVLKKIRTNSPISSAAKFFSEVADQKVHGGFHTFGYVASAHVAPVESTRGVVELERGKSMWDDPLWLRLSHGLVQALSTEERIGNLIGEQVIAADAFMESSIVATRMERLTRAVGPLAVLHPNDGIVLVAEHAGKTWKIDSQSDQSALNDLYMLMDGVVANATIGLASQIARTARSFVGGEN